MAQINRGRVSDPAQAALSGSQTEAPGSAGGNLTVSEIRDLLGVRAADNLRHAELVLIVEGSEDAAALEVLLRAASQQLAKAMHEGILVINAMDGASNLPYKASLLREALCEYHCYLDDDDAGRRSIDAARNDGLLTDAQVNLTICNGMVQSEIEDIYDPDVYRPRVERDFVLSLQVPSFRSNKKWSERMRETFLSQGKQWNDRVKSSVKAAVAEEVIAFPHRALGAHKRGSFDGLVSALTVRLNSIRK